MINVSKYNVGKLLLLAFLLYCGQIKVLAQKTLYYDCICEDSMEDEFDKIKYIIEYNEINQVNESTFFKIKKEYPTQHSVFKDQISLMKKDKMLFVKLYDAKSNKYFWNKVLDLTSPIKTSWEAQGFFSSFEGILSEVIYDKQESQYQYSFRIIPNVDPQSLHIDFIHSITIDDNFTILKFKLYGNSRFYYCDLINQK